jgi:hypothetical protein
MSKMRIDICIPTLAKEISNVPDWLPVNKVILSNKKGFANARNDLMQKAATEWFLFLDDDVELNIHWWNHIQEHISEGVGAISGIAKTNSWVDWLRTILIKSRGIEQQRGFTSNTLIRKKAVEGIVLEREGRLEDRELQKKIQQKGYLWVTCPFAVCRHRKKGIQVLKEAIGDFNTIRKEEGFLKALLAI